MFRGHTGSVVAVVTDTDARLLYTASGDKTIRSWHIDTGVNFKVSGSGVRRCWFWVMSLVSFLFIYLFFYAMFTLICYVCVY